MAHVAGEDWDGRPGQLAVANEAQRYFQLPRGRCITSFWDYASDEKKTAIAKALTEYTPNAVANLPC